MFQIFIPLYVLAIFCYTVAFYFEEEKKKAVNDTLDMFFIFFFYDQMP